MSKSQVTLNCKQAADFLHVGKNTIVKLIEDGKLVADITHSEKSGRKGYYITLDSLKHYDRQRTVARREANGHAKLANLPIEDPSTHTPPAPVVKAAGLLSDLIEEVQALRRDVAQLLKVWS